MTFLRWLYREPLWYYSATLASAILPAAVAWWLVVIPIGLVLALLWVRP
jgi:hypothetical protein